VGKPLVGLGTAEDCTNTYVINELGIPIVAMGLRDAVVVASPDGILVSDLKESAKIKNAVAAFDQRPMMEERFWGNYRVLDYSKLDDGTEVITKMLTIHAGRTISYHKHMHRTENWTIVAGRGEIVIGTNLMTVQTGDVLRAFPDQWHAIRATETMQIIEVQQGQELVEEDILRRFDHWQEMVDHISHMAI
jgi:mannose-1-phosphate guanylyltransferase